MNTDHENPGHMSLKEIPNTFRNILTQNNGLEIAQMSHYFATHSKKYNTRSFQSIPT